MMRISHRKSSAWFFAKQISPLLLVMLFISLFAISTSAVVASSVPWPANGDSVRTKSETRTLNAPPAVPTGKNVVDANFQSYSIEFSYMLDFAGNKSNPNKYSYQLLQNLAEISGASPIIRAGGTTQNRATFVANQAQALTETFSASSPDQPSSLSIGLTWIESFQQFPKGTKYIYGLNFGDGDAGLNQTILEAVNAYGGLGDNLYAFEIGNEVDGFPCGARRPCNWTIESYVGQWLKYAAAIAEDAVGSDIDGKIERIFQGCAFEAPRHLGYNETAFWNIENAIKYGITSTGRTKTVADHDYMGSACSDTTQVSTIAYNLLNHTHMTSIAYYHEYLGNASAEAGVTYVLGETNSVSCQGLRGVSDVFAAALWSVDYVMYIASLKVNRLYFHMGTPYRYSAWQPITIDASPPHVKPLYYGNLFTATAFAGGDKQVLVLINETSLTAYGIYDRSQGGRLRSVVIVNLEIFNSTSPASERHYVTVQLQSDCSRATAQRLTSPGVEIASNITFAGQSINNEDGTIIGRKSLETVINNQISVGAGEAVLVTL